MNPKQGGREVVMLYWMVTRIAAGEGMVAS